MSSYWAANYGVALVLKEKEFSVFLERYAKKHSIDADKLAHDIGENDIQDFAFIRSKVSEKTEYFDFENITPANCDGMYLLPFYKNGKKNKYFLDWEQKIRNEDFGAFSLRNETLYVVFSDKSMTSVDAFDKKPYESYDTLVKEFKDKLQAYLPDDFDWDIHIGNFSYAAYA